MPRHIKPMLAKLAALPSDQRQWAFEYKWDGVRAILYWDGSRLSIDSRNLLDITPRYPELAGLCDALGSRPAVLDGEIVALDSAGRVSFGQLQYRMHVVDDAKIARLARTTPVYYMVFDLLHLGGESTLALPYARRRTMLEDLSLKGPNWQTPPSKVGDGTAMLQSVRSAGMEGLIAKRIDSRYEPGGRSGAWLKIKISASQELVIGGYLPGQGMLTGGLGSVLVGYYRSGQDKLQYAGAVGTGYTDAFRRQLQKMLDAVASPQNPFSGAVPRGTVFCQPKYVCEVSFTEWTADGIVRHPVFKGLRLDKDPAQVVRESAVNS